MTQGRSIVKTSYSLSDLGMNPPKATIEQYVELCRIFGVSPRVENKASK